MIDETTEQIDSTTATDVALIAHARRIGVCVYAWPMQSESRSLYALPDGTGLHVEQEWGGGASGQPWERSYAQPISAAGLAEEIRRYNSHLEYEGKIGFSNPFGQRGEAHERMPV